VAGFLQEYRALGGVAFALLRDGSGVAQVTLKKGSTDPALFVFFAETPRESVVDVEGRVQKSAKAQRGIELVPRQAHVVTRAQVPLPLGVVDKVGADLGTRFDHRVLDLRKPEVRAIFELRGAILQGFRETFLAEGFIEIETPKLLRQGAEGGATLFPVQYFDERAYLAQSPQLYKQMMMSAGFERVFEIAPAFRAEPSDTVRHITEFTSLDGEISYVDDPEEVRAALETVVVGALVSARKRLAPVGNPLADRIPLPPRPFPRVTFADCERRLGRPGAERDLATEDEKRLGDLLVPEFGNPFYFITDYPTAVKAQTFYAMRLDDRPMVTGYFDLDYQGLELASGGLREHRYDRLVANMRSAGVDPASFEAYLEAFRFGMPPHGGWGFGIDRFVQSLVGLANIRESRLFPRDRYRLSP
jgi:nondiscriminating aspartyl-tRNA synthetase